MLQRESRVKVADNSGARELLVIHIPGDSHRRTVSVGDIFTGVVKSALPKMTVKRARSSKLLWCVLRKLSAVKTGLISGSMIMRP